VSVIALATVKAYLRVTHSNDDALLQALLDGAEDEALRFMNRDELPGLPYDLPEDSSSEPDIDTESAVAGSVVTGVCLLVRADYDAVDPEGAALWRRAAETKLQPYRTEMGP
jgi:hypothetical protein